MSPHADGIELLPDHVVAAVKSVSKQRGGKQKALRDVVLEGIDNSDDGKYTIVIRRPICEDGTMICYGVLFFLMNICRFNIQSHPGSCCIYKTTYSYIQPPI